MMLLPSELFLKEKDIFPFLGAYPRERRVSTQASPEHHALKTSCKYQFK
jgi:hypothetical protein